ncbi:superoxide dismutase family protein [Altererythrobacter sp. TH136]|nr:superoxide dismutase family protein [Altererythrobacter sp. TH136]
MVSLKVLVARAGMLALAGCSTIADLPQEELARASLTTADGRPAGTVRVVATGSQVSLLAGATGISPGTHGIHLHTTGACRRPDFTSAGGHLNPLNRAHGSLAPGGQHVGDLPNIVVQAGGSGTLTADLAGTPDQVRAWLFDSDGTAVVIHADPDDYRTDPSGNSGGRIACGVVTPG